MLAVRAESGRLTRFLGCGNHQHKHDDKPNHDAQDLRPAPASHQHHPLSSRQSPLHSEQPYGCSELRYLASPLPAKPKNGFAGALLGVANRLYAAEPFLKIIITLSAAFCQILPPFRGGFLPRPLRRDAGQGGVFISEGYLMSSSASAAASVRQRSSREAYRVRPRSVMW